MHLKSLKHGAQLQHLKPWETVTSQCFQMLNHQRANAQLQENILTITDSQFPLASFLLIESL